eukprot:scaffold89814_cov35-Tisochrysis_lutea.AAC.2
MEAAATEGGHLEVLAWLHAQGCPWDERPCCAAAARNNVRLLEWLRAHGCPWGVETCAAAARAGGSRAGEAGIGRVRWHETPVRPPTGVPGPLSPDTSDKGGLTTAVLSLERGEGRPIRRVGRHRSASDSSGERDERGYIPIKMWPSGSTRVF